MQESKHKVIKLSELRQKTFCNSKSLQGDFRKVIIGDIIHEWQGIGWVECGEATDQDKENYPTIIEG